MVQEQGNTLSFNVMILLSDDSEATLKKLLTLMLMIDTENGQNERNLKKGLHCKSNTSYWYFYPWFIIYT